MISAEKKGETAPIPEEHATARRHGGMFLAVLLMAPFLAQVDATSVNVATPSIGAGEYGKGTGRSPVPRACGKAKTDT
jgi:hypothetical protein